jgi:hypothetical protein
MKTMLSAGQEISDLFFYLAENDLEKLISYFKFKNIAGEKPCGGKVKSQTSWRLLSAENKNHQRTEVKGREVVGVFGKGTLAGELCMLDSQTRVTSATAMENSTLLLLGKENSYIPDEFSP